MTWLNPAAWLLLTLIVPVILLYIFKPRPSRLTVSSSILWQEVLAEAGAGRHWHRLRQQLPLWLQLLIVILLVIALVGPMLYSPVNRRLIVVVLDASASMQATDVSPSRFAIARDQADQIFKNLGPSQQGALVLMSNAPRVIVPPTGDTSRLHSALTRLEGAGGMADVPGTLALVAGLVSGIPSAQVILVTDGQIPASDSYPPLPWTWRPVGGEVNNLGVSLIATRSSDISWVALVGVKNSGSSSRQATLTLLADSRPLDSQEVKVEPGEETFLLWDRLPENFEILEARLSGADDFKWDDYRWSLNPTPVQGRVLLVSEDNPFWEHGLTLVSPKVERIAPKEYNSISPEAYDLVVFDRWLPERWPSTPVIVLSPPQSLSPLKVGITIAITGQGKQLESSLLDHIDLRSVSVANTVEIEFPGATVLWEAQGIPLLLQGEHGGNPILIFGPGPADSNLVLQETFPVFLHNVARFLLPGRSIHQQESGELFQWVSSESVNDARLLSPDRQLIPLTAGLPARISLQWPGLYQLYQQSLGEEKLSPVVVNLPVAELPVTPPGQLPLAQATSFPSKVDMGGKSLSNWFLGMALVILLAEWWVVSHGY